MAGLLARRGREHGALRQLWRRRCRTAPEREGRAPITTHTGNDLLPKRLWFRKKQECDYPEDKGDLGLSLFSHVQTKERFKEGEIQKERKKEKARKSTKKQQHSCSVCSAAIYSRD